MVARQRKGPRAKGLVEKANDVARKTREERNGEEETDRTEGGKERKRWYEKISLGAGRSALPRIRICINRPLSRGWFIESSGGVCRCESRWLWEEDRLKESNNVCWARR